MTNVTISISIVPQIFRSWVAIYQLRPSMASLSHSLYDMSGLASCMNVLFSGATRLSNKLLEQGYVKVRLKSVTSWRNSTFYRLMRGFHRTFAIGIACWHGTLTPPDTWSRPIWDLHMFYLLRPILFPNLSLLFADHSLRTSLGALSILLF